MWAEATTGSGGIGDGAGNDIVVYGTVTSSASSSILLSSNTSLTESNLNGAEITLTLSNETFVASPQTSDFTLNNAPAGTSISGISRNSDTETVLTLAFDGSDFDSDIDNFNVTASAAALTGDSPLTSNNLTIDAFTAPDASTNAATSTFDESATLNGTVSANGYGTSVSFEYGITDSYGSTATASQSPLASDASSAVVSVTITGLSNGQEYHYRVKAENTEGITYGSDQTFTPVAGINAWINEFHYDNASTDVDELIEIVIENSGNYNLSDIQVDLYNGSDGKTYTSETLNNFDQGSNTGNYTFFYKNATLQNGPDGIALSYQGSLIQFLSYGGSFVATNGPAIGQESVNIGVTETSSTPVGYSLQLKGGGLEYEGFSWTTPATATAGSLNNLQVLGTEWIGATSNDWSNAENWNNGVPTSASDALIPSSGISQYPAIEAADNAAVKDLVLAHNAQINGQENLSISGSLTVNHQITKSTSATNLDHWQYFTSPFTSTTSGNLLSSNARIDLYLLQYNNTLSAEADNGWEYVTSTTAPFSAGMGYALTFVEDATETGTATGTDYNLSLSGTLLDASSNATVSLSRGLNNWNLIGNPYLAPLNWFDDSNLDFSLIQGNAAYVYNPASSSYISITSTGSGSGTVSPSGSELIPPLQGFFVEASAAGNFELDKDARVNTAQSFYKSETITPRLRIQVKTDSLTDETVLVYNEMAEPGFDALDAHKLFTNGLSPQVYTTADEHALVFNQLNALDEAINLELVTKKAGTYHLELTEMAGLFNDYRVFLNNAGNQLVEITQAGISFDAKEGINTHHFQLSFQVKTGNKEQPVSPLKVYVNGQTLNVSSTQTMKGHILITNLAGQRILYEKIEGNVGAFDLSGHHGMILVQVLTNHQVSNYKFCVR